MVAASIGLALGIYSLYVTRKLTRTQRELDDVYGALEQALKMKWQLQERIGQFVVRVGQATRAR